MYTKNIILFIAITFLLSFNSTNTKKNPIEKVYTQTDRALYFPGETIWFKSYITNAENKVSTISEVLYAELISPKGAVVKDLKLSIINGYGYGDFAISKTWVGGLYKLRVYTNWMRNFGESSFFEKEINVQKVNSPNVLMTLEFDKKAYGKGSEVIAHFEVKDLKNEPMANQDFDFEVQLNAKKYVSKQLKTDTNGKKDLVFTLPDTLNTTDVVMTVLVPYKNSRESISRSVPVTLNNIDLQFFPESGKAILGIENNIAFKALNEFGKPADISGEIVNTTGQTIANFQSFHDGMGSFKLSPTSENYYARITAPFKGDSLIPIPNIQHHGTNFSITETDYYYLIDIYSTHEESLLLSYSSAASKLETQAVNIKNNKAIVKLNKSNLPTGILKISLTDYGENVVAERLAFVNQSKQLNIDVSLDKAIYKTREKVVVSIKTTDENNNPIPSNLSVSIADNKIVSFSDDKQDNISSYLLMSSELKGKIHKPSFYFDPTEVKANAALDNVLLTHGWRNYINQPEVTFANADFSADTRATQFGKVVDKNYKAVKAHVLLFDKYSEKVSKFDTNEKGEFSFKMDKSNNLVLIAYTDDAKTLKIIKGKFEQISLQKNKFDQNNKPTSGDFKELNIQKPLNDKIKEKVGSAGKIGVVMDADNALEEVVITALGFSKRRMLTGSVVTVVDDNNISTLNVNDIGQLLQGRVTGVVITADSDNYGSSSTVAIRGANSITGNSQPLVIIDGVAIDLNKSSIALNSLDPSTIDNAHVLKGTAASAVYGSNGINGVIIITTKNQNFNALYGSKSLNNKKFRNYAAETFYNYNSVKTYRSRVFYTPVYASDELPVERNDFRQTIYWNPVIQTDKNGEATFDYYNSDAITSFIITTEGIGYNGLVGRDETTYATKKLLNIDFITPNYMALNDTIHLPVTVTNESDEIINAQLTVDLPKELRRIKTIGNEAVFLNPHTTISRTISFIPIAKSESSTIRIAANATNYSDRIEKEITIISPYFPSQATISGFKNDSYQLNIPNVVDGSLTAEFSIYTDIVGNVMDGVESLIRQPYGCFEQVSSSTYPNILVLKYLKETGKSNPEIEKKALDFIKKGYKKLAAYETSKNGFEWYGKSPPHEVLSAYGLMEFTEMKEVYEGVSEPMIQRTITYLMSRKNGKGGFTQNRGKYGFSAAPENVNNAYIVYAISESGINATIEDEYNATYNEALESNDSYRMALLALASINLNKIEQANRLMQKIKTTIKKYGFQNLPVDHTITRSYGNAKEIETTAFTILALLKQGNNELLVSEGVEHLISKRKAGRFGSTQSTSMALKALIEYTKTQKQKMLSAQSIVKIDINGKSIEAALTINEQGKVVIKGLEQYIKEGNQQIQIAFSNPESTFPYSLNIEWDSTVPNSSAACKLDLSTTLNQTIQQVGQNIRLNVKVRNKTNSPLPMSIAIVGIPSGTSAQPWQLKEILEKNKAAYYEIFDNYIVFYWREFQASETKEIKLDLKAEVPGIYQAPASTAYLYYAEEFKHWVGGSKTTITK